METRKLRAVAREPHDHVGDGGNAGSYTGGPVDRPAPDRLPARARAGGHLQGEGVPRRGGCDLVAPRRGGPRPGRGGHAHRAGRNRGQHGGGDRRRRPGQDPGPARACRAGPRRPADRGWPGPPPAAAGRPALPLRLVRRRLPDRGDGLHRDRARARVPRADRPLAAADRGQRPQRPSGSPGSSTSSTPSTSTSPAPGSPCSRGSRSTSSTTVRSTRPTRCSAGSTSASPACTPS